MALVRKSIDEITGDLTDVYDGLLQENTRKPTKVWRNHNNKLYLVFRSIAAGFKLLLDTVLTLHSRFDPLLCDEVDLYTTAKLVGTEYRKGTGSILQVTITNKNESEQATLYAGVYSYTSVSGMIFYFELANDYVFDPLEEIEVSAISREKGSFHVEDNADIKFTLSSGADIDGTIGFSCADNSGQLGYPDEDAFSLRQRILNDTTRQDHIKELELKIRNLPNIFECNLVFNPSSATVLYDNISLLPWELLIMITGAPTNEIARLVAMDVPYATHISDPSKVIYYEHELYVNGRYPVYYEFHDRMDFELKVTYQYNHEVVKESTIDSAIAKLLSKYTNAVVHVDIVREEDIYDILKQLNLPTVMVLDVSIIVKEEIVSYLNIPKTRLPNLVSITYDALDTTEGTI